MACETQDFLTSQYIVYSEIYLEYKSLETCIIWKLVKSFIINANQLNGVKRHSKFNLKRAGLF